MQLGYSTAILQREFVEGGIDKDAVVVVTQDGLGDVLVLRPYENRFDHDGFDWRDDGRGTWVGTRSYDRDERECKAVEIGRLDEGRLLVRAPGSPDGYVEIELGLPEALTPSQVRDWLRARAVGKADAQVFFDEWHEELDPAKTDWDGEAYAIACQTSRQLGDLEDPDTYWPIYQRALVQETRRLAAEAERQEASA